LDRARIGKRKKTVEQLQLVENKCSTKHVALSISLFAFLSINNKILKNKSTLIRMPEREKEIEI
jgi:hypothetical protein